MQKIITGYWFQPKKLLKYFLAVFLILNISACFNEGEKKLPEEKLRVTKVTFDEIGGWNNENFSEIIPVFQKNCQSILKNKNVYIFDAKIKINTKDYQEICKKFAEKNINTSEQMKQFIKSEFSPYAVTNDGNPEGKFTSYYEATVHASFNKSAEYRFPIYGKPNDLIELNLKDFGDNLPNTRLVGRVENNKFIPYYNRSDIENKGINAPILMWGNDLADIHFMQIQGSAVAEMDDGKKIRIGYADNNGRKFKGIGSILIEKGLIKSGDASMIKIREWLRKNPEKAKKAMAENDRFIFQKLVDADGPLGAMGVSLTAGRSIAVDNQYIPFGAMMWLDTVNPDKQKIQKVVFAQDIGSAIKGIVRGDYFWGYGETALEQAGRMNSVGRYYIFAPKNSVLEVK